jgi:cytochrome c-type biogenesis protein CcmH
MKCLVYLLVLFGTASWAIDAESLADPTLHARYRKLTHELRCLQCQNETIGDSNATLAVDLRRELRAMLLAGKSDAEILQFMTDRYGDFVLYRPPVATRTLTLWLAPGLLLVGAGIAVFVIIRRRGAREFDDELENKNSDGQPGAAS